MTRVLYCAMEWIPGGICFITIPWADAGLANWEPAAIPHTPLAGAFPAVIAMTAVSGWEGGMKSQIGCQ